jgi:aspartate/methionine/tyrosine aminotransferase
LLEPFRRFERESRPHLERWIAETDGVLGGLGPTGLSAFPRIAGVEDTRALQRSLAKGADVDVVPGEFFGAPGHLRIGFALPEDEMVEALRRLSSGLESFRATA